MEVKWSRRELTSRMHVQITLSRLAGMLWRLCGFVNTGELLHPAALISDALQSLENYQ